MKRVLRVCVLALTICLTGAAGASAHLAEIGAGVGPDGWTLFEKSPGTRVIYVSSSGSATPTTASRPRCR
ncbi:MAG: hypothetical protein R6X33_02520 [Candidatus Brocadiia bacterium]